ncbi:CHASE2 domain-containing protein [Hahella sp. KA22]|uniref:CHASE2 domain-containing protein n=1 Tax=Hahella sp. KA22 TaxID=1628392 RepID=UPI000FDD9F13|nr:adenylate/guanylate cyclase domain-containing protein [Hahella sp. KA22]AZZ91444.1 adenylate/guanylate cyclase domain-containing protein [Hahella sp. KA22]QAY54813.1 CHASE2 domain-containing protein [Hahella sp. KA22]
MPELRQLRPPLRQHLKLWLPPLLLSLLLALGLLTPVGQSMEEGFGLDTLFHLRGGRAPPPKVAVIAITENTAAYLQVPARLTEWPRSVYGELVDTLENQQVGLIAFDIYFREARDTAADARFADAMARSGKVALFAFSMRRITNVDGRRIVADSVSEPLPLFANAATTTAPFALPKVSSKISRFWLRQPANPPRWAMPAAALLQRAPDRDAAIARLQGLRPTQLYNFYGPPRSIPTIFMEDLLARPGDYTEVLRDATVFIGYAAEYQPDQRDGFYTPFTPDTGLDISGVELAATAYANLLENSAVRYHLGVWFIATLFYATLAFALSNLSAPGRGLLLLCLLAASYMTLTYALFVQSYVWLPWMTPILGLTPAAALHGIWRRVQIIEQQKRRLELAFGRYIPASEIKRLASQPGLPQQQKLFGVCLSTDAAGYTALSESVSPERLSQIMDNYYQAVLTPIRQHGGIISDVAGDGVIALWPHIPTDKTWTTIEPALKALRASIDLFNQQYPDSPLPTRIGLHAGEVVLGHFGASDHFEYRAMGDIVNTTSRIENANKLLGTDTLISETCADSQSSSLRALGRFLLQGKQRPVALFSLMQDNWSHDNEFAFRQALHCLDLGDIAQARVTFARLHENSADSVCKFYLRQCDAISSQSTYKGAPEFVSQLSKV